jgi:hypothetical protein
MGGATDSAHDCFPKQHTNYNFRGIAYLPDCCEHGFGGGPFDNARGECLACASAHNLLDSTTLIHTFRLLARVFVVGSFAVVLLVLGSLLQGDLAKHGQARFGES